MRILFLFIFAQLYQCGTAFSQNQIPTCTTEEGKSAVCVPNDQCDDINTENEYGAGIIQPRNLQSSTCPQSTICCKDPSQNQVKTAVQEPTNAPLSCTTRDGAAGECVANYLCDVHTNFVITDGEDILNVRTKQDSSDSCPAPMGCCQVPEENDDVLSTISGGIDVRSQPAIYPYTRMGVDLDRSGCGWRNPGGVNVTGAATVSVGSEHALPGEFPWTVSVMHFRNYVGQTANYKYLGSGALIHERAVLTAAHIFTGFSTTDKSTVFYVIIGDYDQTGNVLPRKSIKVQNVVIHERYDNNLSNDFALLFLGTPVKASMHVNFICLPPPEHEDPAGTRCLSSGWGKNGFNVHQFIMNKAELPVVDRTTCQSLHRRTKELGPAFILHSSFMCAGEGGVDSCKGSGGAPLTCPRQSEPDRYVLSGLVSWSYNCSLDGIPSVYARVPSARQWIDNKMAANGYNIIS